MLRSFVRKTCLTRKTVVALRSNMSFHFATQEYAACLRNLPTPDRARLKSQTLAYLNSFDPQQWYDDPIVSLLKGTKLMSGDAQQPVDTKNALGETNGRQIMAVPEQLEQLKEHICTYQSPYKDLRSKIRKVEEKLFTDHAGELIGNQALDFKKQDGITEVEEALMANVVEQRLNDLVLRDEHESKILINRKPIYVSCVSNFTNFLDLSRKTLRSLEVGIPCIILGRSNTAQHSCRWTQLLVRLLQEQEIDPGMITFLSCNLPDIQNVTRSCQDYTGNLYTTCSRQLAADIKSSYPHTVASTGGPNTLVVAGELTSDVRDAIQMSATIESSGQCTALRHCVVPQSTPDSTLQSVFDGVTEVSSVSEAVEKSIFDGIFKQHMGTAGPGDSTSYTPHKSADVFVKVGQELPAPGINEYWRKVVVDFSKLDVASDKAQLASLAAWLNQNQPISLAVNGPRKEAITLLLELFEKTGMVVNTVGSSDDPEMSPALTCQARPQEGEVFGEFPPRSELHRYTKFPVVVPSSNPSYDATYSPEFLGTQKPGDFISQSTKALLAEVKDPLVSGYCLVLIDYLRNVAKMNPKHGYGTSRTVLWGLQRPPLDSTTFVCCSQDTCWDDVAPLYTVFYATTARDQIELVVDPSNTRLIELCQKHKLRHTVGQATSLASRDNVFNIVHAKPMNEFPMASNFVSLFLPLGHIKSTMPNDDEFLLRARLSAKWLNTLF